MQLLPVWAIMAATLAPRSLASVDVSCDCRMWHRRQTAISLHCFRGQNGTSGSYCRHADAPDIARGYHYVPGYALVKLYRIQMPWLAAGKTCKKEGSLLATPRDSQAFDGLREIINKTTGVSWAFIGIAFDIHNAAFLEPDGGPVPESVIRDATCYGFSNEEKSSGMKCGDAAPFFCERRLPVSIRDGYAWLEEAGRFYKVHSQHRVHATAAAICRSESARLAVPDTWQRAEALLSHFDPDFRRDESFFIGFTDEAVEGDFVTETGRHLSDMEFQVWGINEPTNDDNGKPENCLTLERRGSYNDMRCDRKLPFICEILPL